MTQKVLFVIFEINEPVHFYRTAINRGDIGMIHCGISLSDGRNGHTMAVEGYAQIIVNHICLFDYLFISSQMSAKPYFIGSTGILLLW